MEQWEYSLWIVWTDTYQDRGLRAVPLTSTASTERNATGQPLLDVLQRLGGEGWELIGIDAHMANAEETGGRGNVYLFKRPKE